MQSPDRLLVIACGALAREITALKRASGWSAIDVTCLPPELHNRPERIPAAVGAAIRDARARYARIFVAYADCGTGGALDRILAEEGVERLPGAHCYEFFATSAVFAALADAEPGTFYLTDFLVRHFERLVIAGLAIDRHPELAGEYFRHYRRVLYLAQVTDAQLQQQARAIAARLGLAYEQRATGYGDLASGLARAVRSPGIGVVVERPRAHSAT
ncbi:MAG TPA: DUF1638 domain-containing protein [Steroidobacteraceae bacterium]|jgi:hypothetical protein|nr:DUF1638 domain-containing protein [Steroidobacteraceae bacterium]